MMLCVYFLLMGNGSKFCVQVFTRGRKNKKGKREKEGKKNGEKEDLVRETGSERDI